MLVQAVSQMMMRDGVYGKACMVDPNSEIGRASYDSLVQASIVYKTSFHSIPRNISLLCHGDWTKDGIR
jgi:hypothetical protein